MGRAEAKREHWQQAAIEAIKQCGSAWLPQVEAATTPAEFLARGGSVRPVRSSPRYSPGSRHPREFFTAFRQRHGRAPSRVCVWVGPGGGFYDGRGRGDHRALALLPITLGPLVLRADTAAVYCLSVLSYELQAPEGTLVLRVGKQREAQSSKLKAQRSSKSQETPNTTTGSTTGAGE